MYLHQRIMHAGVSHTLSEVRREFWVIQARSVVKNVWKTCPQCIRFKTAQPFTLPPMPSWSKERVSKSFPFRFVGLDYFGPLNVSVSGSTQKMCVSLFSCLTTRAMHLERVVGCSSSEFLKALIRFVSRRGCPEQIISDNGAQFKVVSILGDKAWKGIPTDPDLFSHIAHQGIHWKFIVELARWQGGHYERLVGVVKSV